MTRTLLIAGLSLIALSAPALADDKPVNGCYQENYLYPWLDLPSTYCTHGNNDNNEPEGVVHPSVANNPPEPPDPPPHCRW